MTIIKVGTWDGKNIKDLIEIIITKNTEVKIKVQGKKLVVKDSNVDYYLCVPIGDLVEIPQYENCCIEDEIEEIEQEIGPSKTLVSTELSNEMMVRWGLLPQLNKN